MFRFPIIIWELALNLAKFIFILKHPVELRRYLLCGCVPACQGMACLLYAVQKVQAPWWWSKTETCRSDIHVYFNVNFNVFFKLIEVHFLVSELYVFLLKCYSHILYIFPALWTGWYYCFLTHISHFEISLQKFSFPFIDTATAIN